MSSLVTAKANAIANNQFDSSPYPMTAVTLFLKIKCFNHWLNGRGAYWWVRQLINVLALIFLHKSLLHHALGLLFMVPQLYCVVGRCGNESHSCIVWWDDVAMRATAWDDVALRATAWDDVAMRATASEEVKLLIQLAEEAVAKVILSPTHQSR